MVLMVKSQFVVAGVAQPRPDTALYDPDDLMLSLAAVNEGEAWVSVSQPSLMGCLGGRTPSPDKHAYHPRYSSQTRACMV